METFATLFGSLLAFVYHCFDRIVILGHIPLLTRPENIVHFFRDLHLQVLVAAPDKVRAMFLENADTIVSVNRRPDNEEPIVTVTHPSAKAREALAAINPVNLGIEHFRERIRPAAE